MMKEMKISQKQPDLTVLALDICGAHAPFVPPGYAGALTWVTCMFKT